MTELIEPTLAAINLGNIPISAIVAIVAGVLILIMPKLLNIIVAIYLIAAGVLQIMG